MRVVCESDREEVEQGRGCHRDRELATSKAKVSYPDSVEPEQLVEVVKATGYSAELPKPRHADPMEQMDHGTDHGTDGSHGEHDHGDEDIDALRRRLLISLVLTIPVVLMAMIPMLQFDNWQWLSLTLASPVVVWGAWPFHRATWINLRHGAATMDTLISVGVGAAYLWSLWALFFGNAGMPGMTMEFTLLPSQQSGANEIYLEVASAVTVLILTGRYFEAKAKVRSSAALEALLSMGAKDVAVLRDGADGPYEERVPISSLVVGERFVVRPGEKIATDGVVVDGRSAVMPRC